MRTIDTTLKERFLLSQLTKANNANPVMEVIASRPRTQITDKRLWEETIITAGASATCTSVAIRRTGRLPDRVYVSYISGSTLYVKSAALTYPLSSMVWTVEKTVENCIGCALEFDGEFIEWERIVEYRTESEPWLMYVTTSGQLFVGKLSGPFTPIVGSNVTSIDAVRGVSSAENDIDQGLIIFYTYGGDTYYNQRINGTWEGEIKVDIGPANAVSLKCERLFDWRIVLQITDASGALWEVFTKMYTTGWIGREHLTNRIASTVSVSEITYIDKKTEELLQTITSAQLTTLYALSPVIKKVENLANNENDWGYLVKVTFDEAVMNTAGSEYNFSITDAYNMVWHATTAQENGRELLLTFGNFNNASNPVVIAYAPGTATGEVAQLEATSKAAIFTGLIPYDIPAPVLQTIENTIDYIEVQP